MSGQNTLISAIQSFWSLTTPSVSVEATINSEAPGIKTMLVDYFSSSKLFAKIHRKDANITVITIQGPEEQVIFSLNYLKELLKWTYDAAIVWSVPSNVGAENRPTSVTIEDTVPTLKRDSSSGVFLDKEISFGGSATTENVKKIIQETFDSMSNTATKIGVAKGWIPAAKKEHITLKYLNQQSDLEVSTISSLCALNKAVNMKFHIPQTIKLLYRMNGETPIPVTDIKDLREGYMYYVLTVNQELPTKNTGSFSTMEEFFEKLKTDEDMSDEQVATAKELFSSQGITFKQLMKTGDLAMADEKLKEYGITQGGLRTAILAVIKSNLQ